MGVHFKAWLHTQGLEARLDDNFESKLPKKESDCAVLITTAATGAVGSNNEKAQTIVTDQNATVVYGLILTLQTLDMLNKVTLQQSADPDWTTYTFPLILKDICKGKTRNTNSRNKHE